MIEPVGRRAQAVMAIAIVLLSGWVINGWQGAVTGAGAVLFLFLLSGGQQ